MLPINLIYKGVKPFLIADALHVGLLIAVSFIGYISAKANAGELAASIISYANGPDNNLLKRVH